MASVDDLAWCACGHEDEEHEPDTHVGKMTLPGLCKVAECTCEGWCFDNDITRERIDEMWHDARHEARTIDYDR